MQKDFQIDFISDFLLISETLSIKMNGIVFCYFLSDFSMFFSLDFAKKSFFHEKPHIGHLTLSHLSVYAASRK